MLLSCEDIREAVQDIAQRENEKTADRLRAYNLLYGWAHAAEEIPPWLREGGANGVKVKVNLVDDDLETDETFVDSDDWE